MSRGGRTAAAITIQRFWRNRFLLELGGVVKRIRSKHWRARQIQCVVRGRQHRRIASAILRVRDTRRLVNERARAEGNFLRAICGRDRMNQHAVRKAFSIVGLDFKTLNFSTRCVRE